MPATSRPPAFHPPCPAPPRALASVPTPLSPLSTLALHACLLQTLGADGKPKPNLYSAFVTESNAERLAASLCRMRGAALKIGQMLSIQDENVLPPQVCNHQILKSFSS